MKYEFIHRDRLVGGELAKGNVCTFTWGNTTDNYQFKMRVTAIYADGWVKGIKI